MQKETRGRKPISTLKLADKRKEIVTAAKRLFVVNGYKGVSMRRLAREAEMSPMSLYRYFDNKRAILIHIWADVFEKVFTKCHNSAAQHPATQHPATQHSGAIKAVQAYCICFVEYWVDHPEDYLMIYGVVDAPENAEGFFAESPLIRQELVYMHGLLEQAGVPRAQLSITNQQLLCVMHGTAHSLVTIPEMDWDTPENLISDLIRALVMKTRKNL